MDPNVQLELKMKENIILGAIFGVVMLGVLQLLCCIYYFCYKKKITRLVLDNPGKLLETYREQIRNESNSETTATNENRVLILFPVVIKNTPQVIKKLKYHGG